MAQLHPRFQKRNRPFSQSVARNIRKTRKRSAAICAVCVELSGGNRAAALGIKAHSPSPVLALCRALVEAGHDPATQLKVYRDKTLALRVRSIGEAARLEVNREGTGFRPATEPGRASLVRQNEKAAASIGCGAPSTSEQRS